MGCETNVLLPFGLVMVDKYFACMDTPVAIANAIQSLVLHVDQLKQCPRVPDAAYCQCLMDSCVATLENLREAGSSDLPKFHYWIHMCKRTFYFGPPMFASTFLDESLNLQAATAAAASHRANWETRFDRLAPHPPPPFEFIALAWEGPHSTKAKKAPREFKR